MIGWLALSGFAQDAPPKPAPTEAPADVEIVVWGQLAIDVARDKVVREFEKLGYRVAKRVVGKTVLRPPRGWMGRATLDEEGVISFSRPVIGFQAAPVAPTFDPRYQEVELTTARPDSGGVSFWLLPSGGRLDAARNLVRRETRDEIVTYETVTRRTALEQSLLVLPERLDALWAKGTPLSPLSPPLATYQARRGAVLEYWASRTATLEGVRTCETVEDWFEAVVQASSHPITPNEREKYEALRTDGRKLPRSQEH